MAEEKPEYDNGGAEGAGNSCQRLSRNHASELMDRQIEVCSVLIVERVKQKKVVVIPQRDLQAWTKIQGSASCFSIILL